MPRGSTHSKATFLLAAAGGALTYHLGHPLPHVLALSGGALVGLVITPDLDVDEGCISNDIIRKSAGKWIEHLWAFFWQPYARLLPHRSRLSHFPVIGTALRLAYIAIIPALAWWFTGGMFAQPAFPAWGWWAVGGLALADTLHYVMDNIF